MPGQKRYSAVTKEGANEYEKRKAAFNAMAKQIWGVDADDLNTGLFAKYTKSGVIANSPGPVKNPFGGEKTFTDDVMSVAAYLETNKNDRLLVMCPDKNNPDSMVPHVMSYDAANKEYVIEADPMPAPPAPPRKPTLWERFKNIFVKQEVVRAYNESIKDAAARDLRDTMQTKYDRYHDLMDVGKNFAKGHQKELLAAKETEQLKRQAADLKAQTMQKIGKVHEKAQDYFDMVDEVVEKNPQLATAGENAKRAMNYLCDLREHVDISFTNPTLDPVIKNMSLVTTFGIMKDNPQLAMQYARNPGKLQRNVLVSSEFRAELINFKKSESKKEYIDGFIADKGKNMQGAMENMVSREKTYIKSMQPQETREISVPQKNDLQLK